MAYEKTAILQADLESSRLTLFGQIIPQVGPTSVITLDPRSRQEAHDTALLLRRAARRLEVIGKGLA